MDRKRLQKVLYWALLLVGVGLFYMAFRSIDAKELSSELSSVKPIYLLWLLIPSWGGQFLRAWRWRILLGNEVRYKTVYHSLLFGYFVNLSLPRVGEISRCAAVQSLGGTKFIRNLGTVVAERVADLIMLLFIVMIAFYLNGSDWADWGRERILSPLWQWLMDRRILVISIVVIGVMTLVVFFRFSDKWLNRMGQRTENTLAQLNTGISSIIKLKSRNLALFSLLTIGIWLSYFLTTWLWFLALPSASNAGVMVAFSVMVVGSLVKTLPIQGGGMGAYHLVIGELLMLYGLGSLSSKTFALLNHGYQTLFYLMFGGFSSLWIAWKRSKAKL